MLCATPIHVNYRPRLSRSTSGFVAFTSSPPSGRTDGGFTAPTQTALALSRTSAGPYRGPPLFRGPGFQGRPHQRRRRFEEPKGVPVGVGKLCHPSPPLLRGRHWEPGRSLGHARYQGLHLIGHEGDPSFPGTRGAKPSHRWSPKRSPGGATRTACPEPPTVWVEKPRFFAYHVADVFALDTTRATSAKASIGGRRFRLPISLYGPLPRPCV
jgi:hypothetical protein